jgi:hypothetical protein
MITYMFTFLKSLAGTTNPVVSTIDHNENDDHLLMCPALADISGITDETGDGNDATAGNVGDGQGNCNGGGQGGGNGGGNNATAVNGGGGQQLPPPPPPPPAQPPLQLATREAFVM